MVCHILLSHFSGVCHTGIFGFTRILLEKSQWVTKSSCTTEDGAQPTLDSAAHITLQLVYAHVEWQGQLYRFTPLKTFFFILQSSKSPFSSDFHHSSCMVLKIPSFHFIVNFDIILHFTTHFCFHFTAPETCCFQFTSLPVFTHLQPNSVTFHLRFHVYSIATREIYYC